jgi:arsenate reductase
VAQIGGGIAGAVLANLMFDLDAVNWSTKQRSDPNLWLGEVVATMGLVLVIFALVRTRPDRPHRGRRRRVHRRGLQTE